MSRSACILLFAKQPVAGQVKTRLGADLGMAEAAEAYRRLTEAVVRALPPSLPLRVCFTPDEARNSMEAWLRPLVTSALTFHPQRSGDLGSRLQHAFAEAFSAGYQRALVIGSDCLGLDAHLFARAFAALETHDAVLGPSTDGGYYLLGLRRPEARLFAGVDWSTERVLAQTRERFARLGWTHFLLPPMTDVDTLADWRAVEDRV